MFSEWSSTCYFYKRSHRGGTCTKILSCDIFYTYCQGKMSQWFCFQIVKKEKKEKKEEEAL